ncbi:MAG: protein-disulfide reductase DsbD domain-containing protein [Acetobacterales bacterium]
MVFRLFPPASPAVVIASRIALLIGLLCLPQATGAQAPAASDWVRNDQVDVRLVSAVAGTGGAASEGLRLGLHFRMAEGWKIYWRTPGDAGFPPRIDWTGSGNLAAAEVKWPAPRRFELFGLQNYGYEGEVVLPVTVLPEDTGSPLSLRADVAFLTCRDVCIPLDAKLALDLPAGEASSTPFAHLIGRYGGKVPVPAESAGLRVDGLQVLPAPDGARLLLALDTSIPLHDVDVFVEGASGLEFLAAQPTARSGGSVLLEMPVRGQNAFAMLARAPLTLTVAAEGMAAEITALAEPAAAGVPPGAPTGWVVALGLALAGGLILNLMPCVLPVLSLKLLGVVRLGGGDRTRVRQAFLATAAGIVSSFLVLALALIALQGAGARIGWGVQFQQPVFLAAMTVVLTLFAANLWGAFAIPLPRSLAALGTAGPKHGVAGDFLAGTLATLLATPCSAPFLGTAVGFALSRGPSEILAVFGMLGLGLALPYLAVAFRPGLVAMLPRPGPWMVWLRRLLGLLLLGTAGWLMTILAVQGGATAAIGVAACSLLAAAAFACRAPGWTPVALAAGVVLVLSALLVPIAVPAPDAATVPTVRDLDWRPLDRGAIPTLVAEGRTVFVDVTADWCITCKVNKALVLDSVDVAALLSAPGVVRMRGDWTSPDAAIADYLAGFGRYGIPFNAVYGPALPQGRALPELLTVEMVLDAVDAAGNPR